MAVSTQTIVFGIQAILRLGHAAKRAYEDKILDEDFFVPGIDLANLDVHKEASLIVNAAMSSGRLDPTVWSEQHDLVRADDMTPAGLAAQNRIIAIAAEIDPDFAIQSTNVGLTVLEQWSSDAQRKSPLGRIGIELADIALDYVAANPGLFGVEGNGTKLITSVAVSLGELLPDPDNPDPPVENFAASAIRVFVEAGLRAVSQRLESSIDEDHLRDIALSTLKPLIEAVSKPGTSNEPWYDLRDEFLGPVSEAALSAIARNQEALFGEKFAPTEKIGALTYSVLIAIKDKGIADDLGKEGLIRIYGAMLDTVARQPSLFLGGADSDKDILVEKLLVNAASRLKDSSPPFDKNLGMTLITSSFDMVSENAALLVPDIDADKWTETVANLSEMLIKDIASGLSAGLRGDREDLLQRIFSKDQAAEFIDVIVGAIARSPDLVVEDGSPELKALVEVMAKAMGQNKGKLFSGKDWIEVAAIAARNVAENPGRLISPDVSSAEQQLLFKLISAVMNSAATAAKEGRSAGSVLFGSLLTETLRTVIETAAGNAARALANIDVLGQYLDRLNEFTTAHMLEVGRREWLTLFRLHVAAVLDKGQLPAMDDSELRKLLLDR